MIIIIIICQRQGLERASWPEITTQGWRAAPMVTSSSLSSQLLSASNEIANLSSVLRDDQLCLHCDHDPVHCLPLPARSCQEGRQHTSQ